MTGRPHQSLGGFEAGRMVPPPVGEKLTRSHVSAVADWLRAIPDSHREMHLQAALDTLNDERASPRWRVFAAEGVVGLTALAQGVAPESAIVRMHVAAGRRGAGDLEREMTRSRSEGRRKGRPACQ